MNKTGIAVSLAALVGAAYAGATWYAGNALDAKINGLQDKLKAYPIVTVAKRDFKKGFFTSVENVTYQIGCSTPDSAGSPFGNKAVSITLVNTISHQPFSLGIKTRIVYDDSTKAELAKAFKEKEPLQITTRISLTGISTTRISSPAFVLKDNQTTVEWSGLESAFEYDKQFKHVTADVNMPGFSFLGANSEKFKLGAISYKGESTLAPEDIYIGNTSMKINGLQFYGPAQAKPTAFEMGNFTLGSVAKIDAGLVSMEGKGGIDKLTFNGKDIGKLDVNIGLSRLDAKTMAAFNDFSAKNGMLQCQFDPSGQMETLKQLLVQLLAKDPVFKESIKLTSKEGETSLTLNLGSKGMTDKDFADPALLTAKLDTLLAVQIPGAFVERMIRENNDPQSQEMFLGVFRNAVAQAQEKGQIENDGKLIKSKLIVKDGKFELNGKTLSMEELMGTF